MPSRTSALLLLAILAKLPATLDLLQELNLQVFYNDNEKKGKKIIKVAEWSEEKFKRE